MRRANVLLGLGLLLVCGWLPAAVRAADALSLGAASSWMKYYYVYDGAHQTPLALRAFAEAGLLSKADAQPSISAFLSVLFREHPQEARQWVISADLKPRDLTPEILGFWLAGQPAAARELAVEARMEPADIAELDSPPPDFLTMDVATPQNIDVLLGAFYASGDVRYVRRIVDAAAGRSVGDEAQALRHAALWALQRNAFQHERVREFCAAEATQRKGTIAKELKTLLAKIGATSALLQARQDELAASLIPTADKNSVLRWRQLPADKAPQIAPTTRAHRGDSVYLPVFFTGFALDPHLDANVTYDLKVMSPVGKVYYLGNDLPALHARVPARFYVQLAKDTATLRFEPGDPLGTYTISALVRDHVGQRQVQLTARVELLE